MHSCKRNAFTLLELAVVLVIIALIVGGIIAGRTLIRSSELQGIGRDAQRYMAIVQAFQEKYGALPGDMRNATQYWGWTFSAGCTSNTSAGSTSTNTCDGDGSGYIYPTAAASQPNEPFLAWQHLANAGLVPGTYSNVAGATGNTDPVIGTNVPTSGFNKNAGWGLSYIDNSASASAWTFNYDMRNWLTFGIDDNNAWVDGVALLDEDAAFIDQKLDDGAPGNGKVIALGISGGCTNAASTSDYAARYIFTHTGNTCALAFKPPWVQ